MADRAKVLLKLAILFGLLVVVIPLLVGGWLMWRRPLTVDAWMSRLALRMAGLSTATVTAPTGDMTVWQGGEGPVMVLLHGAGDQAGAWARIIQPLVESHRVVIPDLPGHWRSAPESGPIHVQQVLDGLAAVMDACCADEPAILTGNSLGAWIACLYAREHPDRVARVVAVNGGPLREDNPAVNILPADREEARQTMRALMGPGSPMPPGFVLDDVARHAENGPAARLANRLARPDSNLDAYVLDGRLDEVTVPVEIVWGEADGLLTVDYARRMLDGLPAARLHLVKGCGHVPQRECPDRLLRAMLEALAEPPPVPATKQPVDLAEQEEPA